VDRSIGNVLAAATLIAGEMAGFALPSCAGLWKTGLYAWCAGVLAAWGWRVRGWGWAALFALGALLAARTEHAAQQVSGPGGAPALVTRTFRVEEPVTVGPARGGGVRVAFGAHAGPLRVRVMLLRDERDPVPAVGEEWRCTGVFGVEKERYGRRAFWVQRRPARRVASAGPASAGEFYARCAATLATGVTRGLDWCPEVAGLNAAILLGQRGGLSRLRRETFAAAGTVHVFAISGLHVMVVAWLVTSLLMRLGCGPRAVACWAIPCVVAYTLLTGARPSAVRAAAMTALYLLGPVAGRRPDSLSAWAWTALGVYACSPELIFDAGCRLSFAVMLGIVLWLRFLRAQRDLRAQTGVRKSWEEGAENTWVRRARAVLSGFGISMAAWTAGTPLCARLFGRFTPGGLVANLVVLPLAEKTVLFGFAGLLAGAVFPPLGVVFNNLAALCTLGMMMVSGWVAEWSWASWEVEKWSWGACGLWYAAALALPPLVARLLRYRRRRWW